MPRGWRQGASITSSVPRIACRRDLRRPPHRRLALVTGEGPAPLSFSALPVGANRHPGKWVTATTGQGAARQGQRTQEGGDADITRVPYAHRSASCHGPPPIAAGTTPATPGAERTAHPA